MQGKEATSPMATIREAALTLTVAAMIMVAGLSACTSPGATKAEPIPEFSQADVLTAQQAGLRNVEVTVTAQIYKVLRDDTVGLPHQRFLIRLVNGTTVLVAHNTAMAPRVPLRPGDIVRIHGEYIWNEKGGVIHWTHHSDTPRHEGGWIDWMGQRFE